MNLVNSNQTLIVITLPYGAKSIGKGYLQSKFYLNYPNSGSISLSVHSGGKCRAVRFRQKNLSRYKNSLIEQTSGQTH